MTSEIFANNVDEAIVKLNKIRLEALEWNFVKVKFPSCSVNIKFCNTLTQMIQREGYSLNFASSKVEMKVGGWKESLKVALNRALRMEKMGIEP